MRHIAWLGAVLLAFAGCSARPAFQPHVLRIADASDPASLNPLLAHDQTTIGYDLLATQTLVGLDARNRLVPILARRVPTRANGDISKDGLTIRYRLRRNVRFADGVPFTSADVAFTLRAILDARNPVLSQDAYRRIASLRTPDAHTVVITLKRRWNAAVRELFAESDFAFGILPAHAFASTDLSHAPWEEHAFGTGPFRVTHWQRGGRIVLERNPYFRPRPKLDRIVLEMMPDIDSAFVALRTGGVDTMTLDADQVSQARALPGIRVLRTPVNGVLWLTLESGSGPTADPLVCRAIARALDVGEIERRYHGLFPRAASFIPPVMAGYAAHLAPPRQNLAGAASLLDRAGWQLVHGVRVKAGKPLRLLFVSEPGPLAGIEPIVQRQLAAVGIQTTIKSYPAATFNAPGGPIRTGRFGISADGFIGGSDPEQSVVFACGQIGPDGNNIARFCDPAFDALYADQATTGSEKRRRADFVAMQRSIASERPIVPLNDVLDFDAVSVHVHGFARNMLEYPVAPEAWDVR